MTESKTETPEETVAHMLCRQMDSVVFSSSCRAYFTSASFISIAVAVLLVVEAMEGEKGVGQSEWGWIATAIVATVAALISSRMAKKSRRMAGEAIWLSVETLSKIFRGIK